MTFLRANDLWKNFGSLKIKALYSYSYNTISQLDGGRMKEKRKKERKKEGKKERKKQSDQIKIPSWLQVLLQLEKSEHTS